MVGGGVAMGVGRPRAARAWKRARWLLGPARPSAARRLAQEPVLREAAAQERPHGRCLNAGSGTLGVYNGFLESFVAIDEIVNLDVEQPEISERRSDARHTDMVGSITELPFADESFDWILCTNVLPLVPDDHTAAAELGRVLKRGGCALISVRTLRAPVTRYQVAEYPESRPREGYSLKQLRELLAPAGLQIVWQRHSYNLPMTLLFMISQWQSRRPEGLRRVLLPRFAALAIGYADRWVRLGRSSDLTVLAKRA